MWRTFSKSSQAWPPTRAVTREAARLFGAAASIRGRTGEVRFQIYQAGYEASVDAVRNAMGEDDFEAAWTEGAAMSNEEAIAYAQRGRGERKRPASGWASLTPTEHDVVKLVSAGLANKDIATRLFVSPRTVETHLTHVYTKLGISSRVQLAQEAARRPDYITASVHVCGKFTRRVAYRHGTLAGRISWSAGSRRRRRSSC